MLDHLILLCCNVRDDILRTRGNPAAQDARDHAGYFSVLRAGSQEMEPDVNNRCIILHHAIIRKLFHDDENLLVSKRSYDLRRIDSIRKFKPIKYFY